MVKSKSQERAVATQIVGTFLVVISAYILVAYVFVAKVNEDILKYKEEAKEYAVIAARKVPEYTQLASAQGAYQAVYEVGIRGGYNNRSVGRVDHLNVSYGAVNVSTAIWMDERVDRSIPTAVQNIILKIPEDKTIEGNLTEVIRNATLAYLRRYGAASGADMTIYENATFMVNRSECVSAGYVGMGKGCFNITIIPTNYTQKNYPSSGSLISATTVTSTTNTHIDIRLFKMYELMRSFIRNNFLVTTGSNIVNYNLLAKQVEETTACPAGSNCDWDVKTRTTQYCRTQDNCDYASGFVGLHAKLDYSCVPRLTAPACKKTIRDNLINKIGEIESEINRNTMFFPYVINCPASVPNCESAYYGGLSLQSDPATGNKYVSERFKWAISPPSPKTWDEAIQWDGTSDDYNILWWNQNTAGECKLPQGAIFKTDTQPTGGQKDTQTNIAKDSWTRDTGFPSYLQNFPEGTACADAYFVDCHEVKQYKTQTGGGSWWSCCGGGSGSCYTGPDPTAWCEMDAYAGDPAHTATCGSESPYGGIWCSQATTTVHYSDSHGCSCSCPWTSCPSSYGECHSYTDPGLSHVVDTKYVHCDIKYDFYGHFKYRARLDPLLVTLTDESKTIPVTDIYGQTKLVKPELKDIYKGAIYEEPHDDDKCLDREGDEDKTGSRYRHTSDDDNNECPKQKNTAAQRTDYYDSAVCNTCTYTDNATDTATKELCIGGLWVSGEYCNRCGTGGNCFNYLNSSPVNFCSDGTRNCGENRTDCGGACAPCQTCATLTCSAPNNCCGKAEDNIDECTTPAADPVGATCRTDCECQSGSCNTTSNRCNNFLIQCAAATAPAPRFEQAITPDGCPLNLSLNFTAPSGTQFKIEATYKKGADTIEKELCRTGASCGISETVIPSANTSCKSYFTYAYEGYYPWNCSAAAPIVQSDYQLTKLRLSSLDGSDLNLFALNISASRSIQPTKCTSCGGTAYWDFATLKVTNINPGTCVDNSAGSTGDILNIINCESITGKSYGDDNSNGEIRTGELAECCDGTPPVIKLKKPVKGCGNYTNFTSPCTFQINVTTDENARCRYSEDTEVTYDSMLNLMDSGFVDESQVAKSLTNTIKTYFIGCSNRIGVKTPLGSACKFTVNCTA